MARPTKIEILTGEFSDDGSPWINIGAKPAVDLDTLEYSDDGSPWYGVEEISAGGNIKTWDGITFANAKTINSVAIANVKTINGITV